VNCYFSTAKRGLDGVAARPDPSLMYLSAVSVAINVLLLCSFNVLVKGSRYIQYRYGYIMRMDLMKGVKMSSRVPYLESPTLICLFTMQLFGGYNDSRPLSAVIIP